MQYGSKIVTHSISDLGNDIITWEITIPKWMVAEFNTHKVEIERNSASSRAVPTRVIIDMVKEFPCMPIWTYNQSGMTANEPLSDEDREYAETVWLDIRDSVIEKVQLLQKLPSGRSVSKGTANRPLEFVMWTVVVVTMTGGGGIGINNFFGLRDHSSAQPEFQVVAHMMHEQYHNSVPVKRLWHLPYITGTTDNIGLKNEIDKEELSKQLAIVSSARCGRVTHYRQGQEYTIEEDLNRGNGFANSGHFSPLRHASRAGQNTWYGNMYGWKPISKIIMENDYVLRCCDRSKSAGDGSGYDSTSNKS